MKVENKEWKPLKTSRYGPPLSHLFFADDLLLFTRASGEQMRLINRVLEEFCQASWETISKEKSVIFCSRNVSNREASMLCSISKLTLKKDLGVYLGVPLPHHRITSMTYRRVLDKVLLRLNSWAAKSLSLTGRTTLGQAVVLAIPYYTMQTTTLPASILLEIEKACRKFLWGTAEEGKKLSLVDWRSICQPKECGGLGFTNLRICNEAFMIKLAWQIITRKDDLWVRVLKNKYMKEENHLPTPLRKSNCSSIWSSIQRFWDKMLKGVRWLVNSGKKTWFWTDSWLGEHPLIHFATQKITENERQWSVKDYTTAGNEWNGALLYDKLRLKF